MDYKEYKLDNCDVYFIKTDKFKSTIISTIFLNEYDEEILTKNSLLRRLLNKSNKKCKNEIDISRKVLELYNSKTSIGAETWNNLLLNFFEIEILNEKYTESGSFEKTLDFYFDTIFNPNVVDNKFEKENFKLCKKAFENYFKTFKDNKVRYSVYKTFNLLEDAKHLRYDINGSKKFLNDLDEENMYEYYLNFIKNSKVEVFVIGDFNDEYMLEIIKNNIDNRVRRNIVEFKYNNFKPDNSVKRISESDTNKQTRINMLFEIENITDRERYSVFPLFNRIYGLVNTSKLFTEIREKRSLAYAINSESYPDEDLLMVLGGISLNNVDEVIKRTKLELENMQKGNFKETELESAKKSRKLVLNNALDDKYGILWFKQRSVITNDDNLKEKMQNVDTITKEEVINLAKKIKLKIIFTLEGENDNE